MRVVRTAVIEMPITEAASGSSRMARAARPRREPSKRQATYKANSAAAAQS